MDKEVIMAIITSTIGCVVSILFENASQETSLRKRALDYFTFSENLSRHAGSRDDEELARFYQLKGVNDLEKLSNTWRISTPTILVFGFIGGFIGCLISGTVLGIQGDLPTLVATPLLTSVVGIPIIKTLYQWPKSSHNPFYANEQAHLALKRQAKQLTDNSRRASTASTIDMEDDGR